jgi:hypothetical protein
MSSEEQPCTFAASELADQHFVGPVRLPRSPQIYRVVRWTRGQRRGGETETSARMVRLSRVRGVVGECKVAACYVPPETRLEVVAQIIALDEYQTLAIKAATSSDSGASITLRLCGSIAKLCQQLSATRRRYDGNIKRKQREQPALLHEIGTAFRLLAIGAHLCGGLRLSDLSGTPEPTPSKPDLDGIQRPLLITASRIAGLIADGNPAASPARAGEYLQLCTELFFSLNTTITLLEAEIFDILSMDAAPIIVGLQNGNGQTTH